MLCVAIKNETDDKALRVELCTALCLLLSRSGDIVVMEQCKHSLLLEKDDDLLATFAEITTGASSSEGLVLAAVAMSRNPDWQIFVKNALGDPTVASASDMSLCKSILQHISLDEWEQIVASTMIVKLKAKPETLLDVVEALTRFVNPTVVVQSQQVSKELVPVLMKQLKSPKEPVRDSAAKIMINLATASTLAARSEGHIDTATNLLEVIAEALSDTKTLGQAYQRLVVYSTLNRMGTVINKDKTPIDSKVVSTVLSGVCGPLSKETKAATEAREEGLEALLRWMVVAKRNNGGGSKGYDEALSYLRKPVVGKNGPDSVAVLGTMIQLLHSDLVESIVLDLWKEDKFVKGLEALVESSNKKHSGSSNVAPVDGVVAVHLALIYASASSTKKLAQVFDQALSAGSDPLNKTSFIFGKSMTEAVKSNRLVGLILPQTIAMYTKLQGSADGSPMSKLKAKSAVANAMACSIAHPTTVADENASAAIESSVQVLLDYRPASSDALISALFNHVNQLSLDAKSAARSINSTRQAREAVSSRLPIKGQCSPTGHHGGMDPNSVRRVAKKLAGRCQTPKGLGKVLVLMHVGSTLRTNTKQRSSLVHYTTNILTEVIGPQWEKADALLPAVADVIAVHASLANSAGGEADDESKEEVAISEAIHLASLSFLATLGAIACKFSPSTDDAEDEEMRPYVFASRLCTKEVASRLSENIKALIPKLEGLSQNDVDLYRSTPGVPFRPDGSDGGTNSSGEKKKSGGKNRLSEEEEWEQQVKKELASKKKADASPAGLTAEDKKLVMEQEIERQRLASILEGDYVRVLKAVEYLVLADIEIGNACLPIVSEGVLALAVSDCPAIQTVPELKSSSLATLTTLATCVYEIQEEYAPMIAMALTISCRKPPKSDDPTSPNESSNSDSLTISSLPSPCEPAATTIFEMDEFQEELSGPSFAFLFPVVRAALMGPRTTPGCEGALRVLERHTPLLAGEKMDSAVSPLRKDMAVSVLELLKHDRAQTFSDPSAYDALVACYQTNTEEATSGATLTTAELAPLLDERGALGNKSSRTASMIALGAIAKANVTVVKKNPLIENRIWLNCFEKDESIRNEARRTWGIVQGSQELADGTENVELPAPSPMYAVPLLPLLSNDDKTISSSAADAYAHGMAAHPNSVNRNIQKLCSTYIESFPGAAVSEKASTPAIAAAIPAKKPVAPPKKPAGIPASLKKKTVKKSALQVAGIGQPKKTTKKKTSAVAAAMLKPKVERTLDDDALVNQFKTGPQKAPPEKDSPDKIATRLGVLRAISSLTAANVAMDIPTLTLLTSFLMAYGIADMDETAKNVSRDALRDIVASNGGSDEAIAFLLPHLDKVLKTGVAEDENLGSLPKEKILRDGAASDRRKEGAVVALGSVALHLKGPESAGKIDETIDMLLQSLKTPNEDVQSSVADCLAKLMKKGNTQERLEGILTALLTDCLHGETSAIRRGAAYGIAAAVKGSGIASLKKYALVTKLEEACSSGSSGSKEGSLFTIELLCTRLGLLFEPYVIVLLPSLLKSFSDSSDHVRKAASHAVEVIMSKLSAHGVKLVMPAVLTAFNDKAWRTKQASIHMLGSMSHLAPKQLASALPKVVPKLSEAFSDTHPKVKASAQEALDEVSKVIRNPEISSVSPVLLKALTDPADGTVKALETLIETEFLHAIDAPSLALIVPILHRGLRDRGATTKRYGALIAGNICTMINDPRDFVPYIPTLLPDLKESLLDPIPDVRSIAAKALGSLTRGLGEETLPDLRPWLVERLRSEEGSSAERSGAAQGLTEVLIASGTTRVEDVMLDDILPLKSHPEPCTREGVLWVLTFLPPALGHGFTPLLDASLPALISGLSDENEQVRDVAMRAGRVLIKSHGRVHVNKILPILENGMADEDFRIRLSSLMLLGDLLSMIGGTVVLKTDGDTQDDVRRAERAQAQLTLALGMETRNRVLSGLYLARSDSVPAVRHSAVQIWKTVVSVTARTLRQILAVLVTRVVTDLASGHAEKTEIAGKCLGDIVSKLGDAVLPEIIPVLRNALYDGDNHTRRGVCVGLSEVIQSSTKDHILKFIDIIVKVVQDALCDDDDGVREMAASSFQHLHSLVGNRAMDEVVPSLMVALETSGGDETKQTRALNGLTGILSMRSRELLPYIMPKLIGLPISLSHAKALAGIATVTGGTIHLHFGSIIPAILNDLSGIDPEDRERETALRECTCALFSNTEEAGVNKMFGEITSKCGNDKFEVRKESCWMLEMAITEREFINVLGGLCCARPSVLCLDDDNITVTRLWLL